MVVLDIDAKFSLDVGEHDGRHCVDDRLILAGIVDGRRANVLVAQAREDVLLELVEHITIALIGVEELGKELGE